jgi:hypothetical protein
LTRVAVTLDQVDRYGLVKQPGKPSDPRAAGFVAKYGELFQVEAEALDPAALRALFEAAIASLIDEALVTAAIARENDERSEL